MMKKSKFLIAILVAVTISFSCICNVSAQSSPGAYTVYANQLPDTVVRRTDGTVAFLHQATTPQVRDWHSEEFQLYCTDRTNEIVGNDTLTKGDKMKYGMVYLLMNAYPTKTIVTNNERKINAYLYTDNSGVNSEQYSTYYGEVFATQYAIWGYQGTLNQASLGNSLLGYTYDNNSEYELYYNKKQNGNEISEQRIWKDANINELIAKAKEADNNDPADSTLSVTGGDGWTKTDDGYKSSLITVAPSSSEASYSAYSLTLEGAPDGVKVYTEAGEDITSKLDNITVGTKVYVFVPSEQAKKGPKFTLKASTTITYNVAYQYVDKVNNPPHQPSVLVGPETKNIEGAISLNVIPDTASSISNSIYFVGVLILLCGAGIIYANVKPKNQTNE